MPSQSAIVGIRKNVPSPHIRVNGTENITLLIAIKQFHVVIIIIKENEFKWITLLHINNM